MEAYIGRFQGFLRKEQLESHVQAQLVEVIELHQNRWECPPTQRMYPYYMFLESIEAQDTVKEIEGVRAEAAKGIAEINKEADKRVAEIVRAALKAASHHAQENSDSSGR